MSTERRAELKQRGKGLVEGQIWKLSDSYVEIVSIGKRLIHYKLSSSLGGCASKAAPVRIGRLEDVERSLAAKHAVLVRS